MSDVDRNSPQNAVINAVVRILRPLVRLLIRHQVTYPFLSDLLKRLYLDVAIHDIPKTGERLTDSRLTLLTGVHRKDIRRLRAEPELLQPAAEKAISLSAQVIATWLSDAEFSNNDGTPKVLWRLATQGEPSFESLVEGVSRQDLRARSLFDEWLRMGVVSAVETNKVQLNADAFGPAEGFDEKIYFFKRNLHEHLTASVSNILGEDEPHFDRCVYFNNLSDASKEELNAFARQQANELVKQINRKARSLQRKDSTKKGDKHRIHFGAFFYTEKQNSDSDEGGKVDEK